MNSRNSRDASAAGKDGDAGDVVAAVTAAVVVIEGGAADPEGVRLLGGGGPDVPACEGEENRHRRHGPCR